MHQIVDACVGGDGRCAKRRRLGQHDLFDGRVEFEQDLLDWHAQQPYRLSGSSNTAIPGPDGTIWRVSKGSDKATLDSRLHDALHELELAKLFGELCIAPKVIRSYGEESPLTQKTSRVAMLQQFYTTDLFEAMFDKRQACYIGEDEEVGGKVGSAIVHKCCQLGAVCVLHADIKPENVVLQLSKKHDNTHVFEDLRLIDFDPVFLSTGCDSVTAALEIEFAPVTPAAQSALFAVLNLILFWTYFDKALLTFGGAGLLECYGVLERALRDTDFQLSRIAIALPEDIKSLLNNWDDMYGGKRHHVAAPPILLAATDKFEGLRHDTWELSQKEIRVAGDVYSSRAICCGGKAGVAGTGFEVEGARQKLAEIADLTQARRKKSVRKEVAESVLPAGSSKFLRFLGRIHRTRPRWWPGHVAASQSLHRSGSAKTRR